MCFFCAALRRTASVAFARWLLLSLLAFSASALAVDFKREVTVEISPQPLASAAIEFGRQTGIQVVTDGADIANVSASAVSGTYSLGEALRLLLIGTGMNFKPVGEVTVILVNAVETVPLPPPPPENAEDATQLDAMVVTAGKREQNINEVAGSVAALSGDMLEKIGAQSFEDYLKLVPGVTAMKLNADASPPIIRGIATATGPFGISARTTGIFVDEIPLSDLFYGAAVIDLNPFDLERVEIMKGPQGTLFGASSIAGALRYITHKPELNIWQAKVFGSLMAVEQGQQKPVSAGMVNIPIGRSAAVRAVGLYRESPGFIDELSRGLEDVNELEQSGYRALGSWAPGDRLKLTATYLQQATHQADAGFADQRQRLERSDTNLAQPRTSEASVANLVGSYDFDWGTLLSSASRITKDNHLISSSDRTTGLPGSGTEGVGFEDGPPVIVGDLQGTLGGMTQELRVASPEGSGRWQWLAGVAYLRFDELIEATSNRPFVDESLAPADPFQSPFFPIGTPLGSIAGWGDAELLSTRFDARVTEAAVFGEVTRWFGERWEATLGGRLFQNHLAADTESRGFLQSALTPGEISTETHQELEEKGFNPKLSARFLVNDNVNLYALAAKGFQIGGIQLIPYSLYLDAIASGQAGPKFKPFKSSTLWNYEVGAKTEWWGGRLQFDATAFHMIWKDLQLSETVAVQGFGIINLFNNIGKATSSGVEVALRVVPTRGLSWLTSASWVNAVTAVRVANSGLNVPVGTQLPGAARFQFANTLSYDRPVSFLGNWNAGIGLTQSYTDRIFTTLSHSSEFGDYVTYDARAHLLNTDFAWQPDLTLAVGNLFDTRGVAGISGCNACRAQDVFFIQPRTATLSLQIRF